MTVKRAATVLFLAVSLLPFAAQPTFALFKYIHVNTSSDADDGADGYCSLREAIIASNVGGGYKDCLAGDSGIDRILIDVPTVNVTHGVMPTLTAPAIIYPNLGGPRAEIVGTSQFTAFTFGSAADGSSITGLYIHNFDVGIDNGGADMTIAGNVIGPNNQKGIYVHNGTVTIGGSNSGSPSFCSDACNRISGNTDTGIWGSMNGVITGNVIGLDSAGTAAQANGHGIDVGGNITIGGATAALRNVISGNTGYGIGLGPGCNPCNVQGNYIGTNLAGTAAIPNGTGIWTDGTQQNSPATGTTTTIGGESAGQGNVISGNTGAGIIADQWNSADHLAIYGNRIGVGSTGAALGNTNAGIILGLNDNWAALINIGDPHSAAGSNTIAYNGDAGVRLSGQYSTADFIIDNSIHDNAGKGIALLGAPPADDGIPAPVITGISPVHGTACANCEVDVYSDNADEGKKYEGYAVADGSGNWTFSGSPTGPNVTATATDATPGAKRGTSEFSAPFALSVKKPDGRIRKGSGSFVGNNIYNTTGLNQTKTGSAARGSTITFGISVQNDATKADAFKVVAAGAATAGYTIKYFRGTTDITAAVVAGTYQTPSLSAQGKFLIKAKVTIGSTAASGSSVTRLVTITSVGNNSKQDAVRFTAKRS
jgi:CSLREA domain-containing protein